jgi:hypothetical protein
MNVADAIQYLPAQRLSLRWTIRARCAFAETNTEERRRIHELRELGLHPVPSDASYVFVEVGPMASSATCCCELG